MRLDSVGQILASRNLDLRDGRVVNVVMGIPQRFPDGNDDYFCPFQIVGMGDERIRYGAGVDPFQAVWLTLQMIGSLLHTSAEAKGGALTWLGQANLGFPVPESIPDEEAFEYTLQNFLRSVDVMTMEPVALCNAWGNYNVAWELVSDLNGDGDAILTMACSYLDDGQKQDVRRFLDGLGDIPKALLVAATSPLANQQAMSHPCWVPLRSAASELRAKLEPVAARNRAYFAML